MMWSNNPFPLDLDSLSSVRASIDRGACGVETRV